MDISYNWLKDLVTIDLPAERLAAKLTGVGLAVEGIHAHGEDFVLDIDLTSNRPDCLSHFGVVRELSAITGVQTRASENPSSLNDATAASDRTVTIEDVDLCNRFTARIIRDVRVGPSPGWLVERLEAVGERSINNIADITNYVMLELGQPMHSFDLDKLSESRIVVRRARSGETIKTLDEVDRNLDSSMLAICDAERPVAVAGVMGGLESSITDSTINVLLEVAYFDRANIRATSRKLNLATEASYRFERGVDIENLKRASDRAAELIGELAGGEADDFIDVYPIKFIPNEIDSPNLSAAVRRLTGLDVGPDRCAEILRLLGISQKTPQTFVSPTWRHDLAIEEDLVEEVARHTGYDGIATELPPAFGAGEYQADEHREMLLRQTLVDLGFNEALSYSFIDTRFDEMFETVPGVLEEKADEKFVTLQDAIIEGAVRMRPSILPGLLDAVRLNLNHQRRDLRLFEIGKVFASSISEDNLPNEQKSLALVLTGSETFASRAMGIREFDFYDAKGALEAALEAVGVTDVSFSTVEVRHLRKGQSAEVSIGSDRIGYIGRLAHTITASYKFKQPVYLAEINLQAVLSRQVIQPIYRPVAKYPGIVRDVSFLAKRDIEFQDIRKGILEQNYELCRSVMFVDVYEGKGLAEGERSVTIRLEYRSDERTLIEQEVEELHKQIVAVLETSSGIRQRA